MRISDWSSDVCSSDLGEHGALDGHGTSVGGDLASKIGSARIEALQALDGLGVLTPNQRQRVTVDFFTVVAGEQRVNLRLGFPKLDLALVSFTAKASLLVGLGDERRSEEHTSELQSLMRNSYAVFCLQNKTTHDNKQTYHH